MEQVQEERFVFAVEWFDKQADLIRNYLLTFYPKDNSIDMVSFVLDFNHQLAHYFFPFFRIVRFEKQAHVPQENGL